MAQRLSEVAANIHPEQIATELFTKAKTFFLDLKAKIAWVTRQRLTLPISH